MKKSPFYEKRKQKEKKIKRITTNLFPDSTSELEYKKARAKYISEYEEYVPSTREYHSGGFFSSGYYTGEDSKYVKNPVLGEAEWNKYYPNGFTSWRMNQRSLTAYGQQEIIDRLNEVIDKLNEINK